MDSIGKKLTDNGNYVKNFEEGDHSDVYLFKAPGAINFSAIIEELKKIYKNAREMRR